MKQLAIVIFLALAGITASAFAEEPDAAWRKVSEDKDRTVKHSAPGHALASQEMDCRGKRYRELSLSLFDEGGARLQTVRKVGPWETIRPGTNGEKIYKVVCE
jgi:hypothetical protein